MNIAHRALIAAFVMPALLTPLAQAAPADEQLQNSLQHCRNAVQGDRRLTLIVATYTRELLDRGGWANPWVSEPHYAAGEPLLSVQVGDGATSRGTAPRSPGTPIALLRP